METEINEEQDVWEFIAETMQRAEQCVESNKRMLLKPPSSDIALLLEGDRLSGFALGISFALICVRNAGEELKLKTTIGEVSVEELESLAMDPQKKH